MRFGQAHRAEEATLAHRRDEAGRSAPAVPCRCSRFAAASRQHGVGRGGRVGGLEERERGAADGAGQLHAAVLGIGLRGEQSRVAVVLHNAARTLRDHHDLAVLETRLVGVGFLVVRQEMLGVAIASARSSVASKVSRE